MTNAELQTLGGFHDMDRFANGTVIDWGTMSYATMRWVDRVKTRLGKPVLLIRGNHGPDGSAIDWTCPEVPFPRVVMECLRLPCAVGVYSGQSIHLDTAERPGTMVPARWMAVKEAEEWIVGTHFRDVYHERRDGWTYLLWSDKDGHAFKALQTVVDLAEAKRLARAVT